jgi:hypothetical protein
MKNILICIVLLLFISRSYSQSKFNVLFVVNNNVNKDNEIFKTYLNLIQSPEFKKVKFSEIKIAHYTHDKFVNKDTVISKKCQFMYRANTNSCGNFSSDKFTEIVNSLSSVKSETISWGGKPQKLVGYSFGRNCNSDTLKLIECILEEYQKCKKDKNSRTVVIYTENIKIQPLTVSFDVNNIEFNLGKSLITPNPLISTSTIDLTYKWSSEPDMKIKNTSSKSTEVLSPQEGVLKLEVSDACSLASSEIKLKSKFNYCDCEQSLSMKSPIVIGNIILDENKDFFEDRGDYINMITREKGSFVYIFYLDKNVCGNKFQLEIFDAQTNIRIIDPIIKERLSITDPPYNDPLKKDFLCFKFSLTSFMGQNRQNEGKHYYVVITPYDKNNNLCTDLRFKSDELLFTPCLDDASNSEE